VSSANDDSDNDTGTNNRNYNGKTASGVALPVSTLPAAATNGSVTSTASVTIPIPYAKSTSATALLPFSRPRPPCVVDLIKLRMRMGLINAVQTSSRRQKRNTNGLHSNIHTSNLAMSAHAADSEDANTGISPPRRQSQSQSQSQGREIVDTQQQQGLLLCFDLDSSAVSIAVNSEGKRASKGVV
jgi:hypothetical protein